MLPLLPHLKPGTKYCEPCAGDGRLIGHLKAFGHKCQMAWDIAPKAPDVLELDALQGTAVGVDCFITNPPWARKILHPLIVHLSSQKPTWLLFDADWMHTRQAAPFLPRLRQIVSVGRVKWMEDSKFTGKDNCAWYCFDAHSNSPAVFVGRAIRFPELEALF